MKKVTELYNFEKFWAVYTRQNRAVSRWDNERTDMEVFIRRTLQSWFVGKFFQIELEIYDKGFRPFIEPELKYKVVTKYIYITNIRFAFAPYHEKITIHFIQPHSETIESVCYGWNDFLRIKLTENEGDFRILKKFYPMRKEEIKLPTLNHIA